MNHEHQSENGSWLGSRRGVVLIVFLAIIGFFLFTEHRAHLFGILPLSDSAGVPTNALLHAWKSWQTWQQW